jgi:hypothetical protein
MNCKKAHLACDGEFFSSPFPLLFLRLLHVPLARVPCFPPVFMGHP